MPEIWLVSPGTQVVSGTPAEGLVPDFKGNASNSQLTIQNICSIFFKVRFKSFFPDPQLLIFFKES